MKYLLLTTVTLVALILLAFTNPSLSEPIRKITVQEEPLIHEEIDIEPNDRDEITKAEMITDIIKVWDMFLEDAGCGPKDYRRERFPKYANELADAIIYYQNNETKNGVVLPKKRDIHILLAVTVTKESSIDHTVIGAAPRFEVGLLQIHGIALSGYSREEVKNNSRLGILLGVKWFASHLNSCREYNPDLDKTEDWVIDLLVGPMSVYQGGSKAIKKNGFCKKYSVARKRINLTKSYVTRIDSTTEV